MGTSCSIVVPFDVSFRTCSSAASTPTSKHMWRERSNVDKVDESLVESPRIMSNSKDPRKIKISKGDFLKPQLKVQPNSES